jgi:hypothetical protein
MNKYDIDILGISECRWTGYGKVKLNTGESVIFSGREDNLHHHGVAIMISAKAEQSLMEWKPINERIIYARFFSKYIKLSIIQVYAPTNDASEEDKEEFYEQLQAVVDTVQKHDLLIVMGDLNAKVGDSNIGFESVIGGHGIGTRNANGEALLDFCGLNNLLVTGTIFPHKLIHKQTWTSPGGRTKNQIDHVLVTKHHRTSVMDTRAMRGADIASDHQLVRTKIKLKLKRKQKTKENRKKFDTVKLQQPAFKTKFSLTLRNKFDVLQDYEELEDTVERKWENVEKAFNETAKEVLGYKKRGQKPWISKESWELVEERGRLKGNVEQAKSDRIKQNFRTQYRNKDKEVKKSMRKDKRKWVDDLATTAEKAAGGGRMKELYEITKTLSNEKSKTVNAVKDKSGNLLTEETARRERWREHFEDILNRPIPNDPVTDQECDPVIDEISTSHISKAEIRTAIKKMNGKSGGKDNITGELLKADIDVSEKCLDDLFKTIWDTEEVPKSWKQGLIVKIPKKGDLTDCGNWRGITLTSVPSKVFGRVLIDRIRDGVDSKLREEQAGFRRGRSTVEQIFILRNIVEQVAEWRSTLYITFVDFEKAFDSVHRESLWKIMASYGIPSKLIRMVKILYKDSECAVLDEGVESEWFKVKTGVKQGDVMSGFIFLLVVDWIMRRTTEGSNTGIRWKFMSKLEDLDFADDIALLSSTYQHMQLKATRLNENAAKTGLKINKKKTEVLRINSKCNSRVQIGDQQLNEVNKYTYLGATVNERGGGEEDIGNRICKARTSFMKLKKIWGSNIYSLKTKVRLFNALVKSVLLYGCEAWKINEADNRRMDTFMFKCYRRILKIRWPYVISNDEILKRTKQRRISEEVKIRRWKWIGHVYRMKDDSHCITAMTWKPEGRRKVGRPRTTWRRTVEKERKELGWRTWNEAKHVAKNRGNWRDCTAALWATRPEEDR